MIRALAGTLAVATVVVLAGCVPSGESRAADLADRIAIAMADDIAPAQYPEPLSGEHLAWSAIDAPRLPDAPQVDYRFDAYDWSGDSGDDEGATFSVRIDVHVLPYSSGGFSREREEAVATRCWRFVVRAIPEWQGAVERSSTECPDGPLTDPQPDDLLEMPGDGEDRIRAVLAVATAADARALLAEQFPDEGFVLDVDEQDGELAVSVFVPRQPSCLMGLRRADGTIQTYGLPASDLLPGEGGCNARAVLPPAP
ncbi:hypothetical protein [Pseudolysinimonas sp.]|jgi:hypothetical protein|uniref:hypothetical protein n=1 Tax=Pseudolysinimonas sp. TaxID=2680009 RepID=UPI003784E793